MRMTFVVPPEPGKEVAAERSAGCTRIVYPMPNIYELIAAACLEDKGHKVKLVDFVAEKGDADAVERFLRTDNSSAYLVWSVNLSRNADFAFRDMALRLRPEAKIIFMGPGATFFPELYLTDNRVTIVRGEPEATLMELAEYLEKDKDFSNLQGLILLDSDGAIKRNPARPLIQDIDTLPFPARHLLKGRSYHNPKLKLSPYTTMVTSRNCPYQCIYCVPSSLTFARELDYRADHGRKPPITMRSPENVAKEIDMLSAEGYKAIGFVDDNFIWDLERTAALCEPLRRHGIKWGCQARVDAIPEPIAKLLGESGCTYIDLGIESFEDEILKFIKKGITSEQIYRAIDLLQKYKVPVKLNILIGTSPLETKETLRRTLRKAMKLNVDQVMFNIVSPFPGTEFYKMAHENGWIKGGEYSPTNVQKESILSYPHLSAEDMEKALYRFNLRYFLSPRVVLKHLRRFKNASEFMYALKALRTKLFWQ